MVEFDDRTPEDNKWRGEKNPAVQFLLKKVVVWLSEVARSDTEHLVEMVFSSLYCCNQEETTQILNHITTVTSSLCCYRPNYRFEALSLLTCCLLLFFLDGLAVGNYPANYPEGKVIQFLINICDLPIHLH